MGFHSQIEDDDLTSQWTLFYRLRDVFRNADSGNEQQTFEAVQHVLEEANVVDDDRHPESPYANRPAYLDDPTP